MGIWTYFSFSSTTQAVTQINQSNPETIISSELQTSELREGDIVISTTRESEVQVSSTVGVVAQPAPRTRRVSFREAISFKRTTGARERETPVQRTPAPHEVSQKSEAESPNPEKKRMSKSDRRAKKSALRLQVLITGEATTAAPAVSPVVAKARLDKIKSQLSEPKSANKVIAELRQLPVGDQAAQTAKPIHAVCLEHPDAEEDALHFAKLHSTPEEQDDSSIAAFAASSFDRLADVFSDMRVIDLVTAPDLGLGQPGDGEGLLAGAVPTPETVLNGVKQITPQLMALGYATGRMFLPDHTGVYPPKDRFSVLTYWWGMEVVMPPPTLEYLASVKSITGSITNFLSAMALVNNGVREILPLVRYIAQYVEIEYNSIKAQDKGKGVVCASTWLIPTALVPRPWDFPEPPAQDEDSSSGAPASATETQDDRPKLPNGEPSHPRPISSVLDIVTPLPSEVRPGEPPVSIQA